MLLENRCIILIGTDTPIGLAIVRDLGRNGAHVVGIGASTKSLASQSKYCGDHYVRMKDERSFIEQLENIGKKHKAQQLIAVSEGDLLLLNRYRARLEASFQLLFPKSAEMRKVLDKENCVERAQRSGIKIPVTHTCTSLSDVKTSAASLKFPVVLKWRDPSAIMSRLEHDGLPFEKADFAICEDELLQKMAKYTDLPELPLIQEYCPGYGLGHMFLAWDGEILMEFQHRRLHEWPPEGGVSTLCESVPLTEHVSARKLSKVLIKDLNWTGVAMVEYRYDPVVKIYAFMEINGRFWGSLPLATAAGASFPAALSHAYAASEKTELPNQLTRPYSQIRSCYWIPETKRLFRLLVQKKAIRDPAFKYSLASNILSYLGIYLRCATKFYVFEIRDTKPFFSDMLAILRKIIGKT